LAKRTVVLTVDAKVVRLASCSVALMAALMAASWEEMMEDARVACLVDSKVFARVEQWVDATDVSMAGQMADLKVAYLVELKVCGKAVKRADEKAVKKVALLAVLKADQLVELAGS